MPELNQDRRHFLGTVVMTITGAQLGTIGAASALPSSTASVNLAPITRAANTSFRSLKQIDAGLLNVGYAEAGPADGEPVILQHGWPYDIH